MALTFFPLYANLVKEIETQETALDEQKTWLSANNRVSALKTADQELIYVLARVYLHHASPAANSSLPYGSKRLKRGIKFNLNKMPAQLVNIIYAFVQKCPQP